MKKQFLMLIFSFVAVLFTGCSADNSTPKTSEKKSLRDLACITTTNTQFPFIIETNAYKDDFSSLPVGVFDSGIGGLTVLAEILKADRFNNVTGAEGPDGHPDFENEHFIYFGDQANMPYGNYSAENKVDFLKELILKDAIFLLGSRYWPSGDAAEPRFDKPPVKAIVIACNTATAYGLMDIRDAIKYWDIPVYVVGVVEAGAQGAVEVISEKGGDGAVGVMATVGTCQSMGYVEALNRMADSAGIQMPEVIQQGSVGLAGAVEGDESFVIDPLHSDNRTYRGPAADNPAAPLQTNMLGEYDFIPDGIIGNLDNIENLKLNSVENYIRYDTATLIMNYSQTGEEPLKTVILGCTHFPFYVDSIKASFDRLRNYTTSTGDKPYASLIDKDISFIDPAVLTAEQLYEALRDRNLLLPDISMSAIPMDEFYISVPNTALDEIQTTESGAFTYEYKYGRVTGYYDNEYVKRVPMSSANLSEHIRNSIAGTMPEVWSRLISFSNESPRCKDLPGSSRLQR